MGLGVLRDPYLGDNVPGMWHLIYRSHTALTDRIYQAHHS